MSESFTSLPLDRTKETDLREWLGRSGCEILKTVVKSKIREAQEEALKKAMNSNGFENYTGAANSALGKAIRYKEFLDVLDELKNQTNPFTVLKPANQ